MIDNIVIDFWFSKNFANIENMKRKYNPNVDLSKFASNKRILSGVVDLNYYQVCCKNFSYILLLLLFSISQHVLWKKKKNYTS